MLGKNSNSAKAQPPRQLYVCVGCNTPLFTSKDFVAHSSQQASYQPSGSNAFASSGEGNSNCQFYFVRQREWMAPLVDATGGRGTGALECYRKVCRRRLG